MEMVCCIKSEPFLDWTHDVSRRNVVYSLYVDSNPSPYLYLRIKATAAAMPQRTAPTQSVVNVKLYSLSALLVYQPHRLLAKPSHPCRRLWRRGKSEHAGRYVPDFGSEDRPVGKFPHVDATNARRHRRIYTYGPGDNAIREIKHILLQTVNICTRQAYLYSAKRRHCFLNVIGTNGTVNGIPSMYEETEGTLAPP